MARYPTSLALCFNYFSVFQVINLAEKKFLHTNNICLFCGILANARMFGAKNIKIKDKRHKLKKSLSQIVENDQAIT